VHGRPGTGKTSLCRAAFALQSPERKETKSATQDLTENMFAIEGKFEQVRYLYRRYYKDQRGM